MLVNGRPPTDCASRLSDRFDTLAIATHECHLDTSAGELDGGRLTDTARGSGEQDKRHTVDSRARSGDAQESTARTRPANKMLTWEITQTGPCG